MPMDRKDGILRKADEFLRIFRQGEEFTRNLLSENERLRFRIAELEESRLQDLNESKIRHYEERVRMLEDELKRLKERLSLLEAENKDLAKRYALAAVENNDLANLYVASYQLHSTLDYDEVVKIVVEIIINLIGADRFAVMLLDEKLEELVPIAAEGSGTGARREDGIIAAVIREGESYFSDVPLRKASDDPESPLVCIPLKIKGHVIGVIAIYSFLVQKNRFSDIDYELFNLLAGHAATAVLSSKLYSRSENDYGTLRNFLELLREKTR